MTAATLPLPISETLTPATLAEAADAVRGAHDAQVAVYPVGGGTALDYGLAPRAEGRALSLAGLNQVIDYTPRDMTIVVESGVPMAHLAATLAGENQHLPIDAPQAAEATLGGVVATNWSGPRRYGYGTLRDYVIGISAVDGRGEPFKGGGRVVKNVAGYDFCKLLIGSLGTIGIVTKLTLKVKPRAETAVTLLADCPDLSTADRALDSLVQAPAVPAAIDLLVGTAWSEALGRTGHTAITLATRFDGTADECHFMQRDLSERLTNAGGTSVRSLDMAAADQLLATQVEFPRSGLAESADDSPLVVKFTLLPTAVPALIGKILEIDPAATIEAHAASGIIIARFAEFDPAELTTRFAGQLRPAAIRHGGSLTVLASGFEGLTRQVVWGGRAEASPLMERIKKQFDPRGILNPGRYLF